jgi:hypothetical protein
LGFIPALTTNTTVPSRDHHLVPIRVAKPNLPMVVTMWLAGIAQVRMLVRVPVV